MSTTTTEMAAVIQTYIERTAYPLLAYNVVFDTFARLVPLPSGNTVRVPTLMPHAVIKGFITEIGGSTSAMSLIPQYTERSIDFFGAYTQVTKKAAKSSLIDAVKYARSQLEQQAARSINRKYAYAISSQRGMRWRRVADADTEDTKTNQTVSSTVSTTQFDVTPRIVHDNAAFPGAQIFFVTGKNAGQGRIVATYSSSTSQFSMNSPFDVAPANGDLMDIVTVNGISSQGTYAMTLGDVFTMAELCRRSGAQGFSPGGRVREDGFGIMRNTAGTVPQLVLFVDSMVALDIMKDSATNGYTDVFKQTDSGLSRYSKGQFGQVNNVSFIMHNEGWRMNETAGAESDTGVVHTPTMVGMNSYFATKFRGVGNQQNGLAFRVKSVGPQTWSIAHEAYIAKIEWDAWLGVGVQNGFHGNVMLCGTQTAA